MPGKKSVGDILLDRYDSMLSTHGDTVQGANWPNETDRRTRFDVMLDLIAQKNGPWVLCDLACGTGELLVHIRKLGLWNISYIGVDRSPTALSYARAKFPDATFLEIDIDEAEVDLAPIQCDYLVANGLFTVKWDVTDAQMWSFLKATVSKLWPQVRRGIAFNVMSKVVDWERADLFHLPMDDAARFLHSLAGRRVRFRADYGLFEYAAYAYKGDDAANRPVQAFYPQGVEIAEAAHCGLFERAAPPFTRGEETERPIPAFRPQLPKLAEIAPYLRRIDASRVYSNHGPLLQDLQRRLADQFRAPRGGVACASSGTSALIGAIYAAAGRATYARPLAIVPALTFAATGTAVDLCGYTAYLADVDAQSWQLDPETLLGHPMLEHVGLVVPVAPFGRAVPQKSWRDFHAETGIPVVIDGAASMAELVKDADEYLGPLLVALSFHATKCFGVGEGGAIVSTDTTAVARATRSLNFGFMGSRDSAVGSTNGKMSEFHAAVGLAELDGWERKISALRTVAQTYKDQFAAVGLAERVRCFPDVAPNYLLFECVSAAQAPNVQACLNESKIDSRLWYGNGLQGQTYFATAPRDRLDVAESLARRLLGLPVAVDLTGDDIARVVAAVRSGVRRTKQSTLGPLR